MGVRENKGPSPFSRARVGALVGALVVGGTPGAAHAQDEPRPPSAPDAAWVAPVRAADRALPRLVPAPRALRGDAPRALEALLPVTEPALTRGERVLIIVGAIVVGVLIIIGVASVAHPRP